MTTSARYDAIAPAALPAIEALENERGTRDDFCRAEAELSRLQQRVDAHHLTGMMGGPAIMAAFVLFEGMTSYAVFAAIVAVHLAMVIRWQRTPRARAIKRVKRAVRDWLAFGRTA